MTFINHRPSDIFRSANLAAVTCAFFMGCGGLTASLFSSTWHARCGWKAEDYFDDPQVIALCEAIEANDLKKMSELIAAGADVNAKGKGNMTPLLWAFPDNKLERFTLLLKHGADPNIYFESSFNSRGAMSPGESVTHLACETSFPGYIESVFAHGGDPNLVKKTKALCRGDTPLHCVILGSNRNRKASIKMLIDKGADIDHRSGITPAMQATSWFGQFDITLLLLEKGADLRLYQENEMQRLIHVVVRQERRLGEYTQQQRADYKRLVQWLEEHGESAAEAKADIRRWDSWSQEDFRSKMDAEIAERKARDKAAPEQKIDRPNE